MGWKVMYWFILAIWWIFTVILWVLTCGCYDRVKRFWRKRRNSASEYDGLGEGVSALSNFNSGVSHW